MKKTLEKIKTINGNTPKVFNKGHDTPHDTYILCDSEGNEVVATFVDQETVFTATANDIREGKVAASEDGVVTGTKVIPSYHTTEGIQIIPAGQVLYVRIRDYEYTKFQAIVCPLNTSMANSVSAEKVVIENYIYNPCSTISLSSVNKNEATGTIDLGITNEFGKPCLIRFFSYKEIY